MKLKKVTPCGNMVLLKLVEQKKKEDYAKTNSGLFIPTLDSQTNTATVANEKKKIIAYIDDIGSGVDQTKIDYKIGDEVMYNAYDLISLGDDDGALYGLTKSESILAVIEAERE